MINHTELMDRAMEAAENDELVGFCMSCGTERNGCEPDAENYKCDECGERNVQGLLFVIMGGF